MAGHYLHLLLDHYLFFHQQQQWQWQWMDTI
jgi:hypothetical protein